MPASRLNPNIRQANASTWLVVVMLSFCLVQFRGAAHLVAQTGPASNDRLDQYLQHLKLDDLRVVHLENRLESAREMNTRNALGEELAGLYASQLLSQSDDSAAYQATLESVRKLTSAVPSANTDFLKVMILQAEYSRAEALIGKWLENRQDNQAKQEALTQLRQSAPQLLLIRERLENQERQLVEKATATEDEAELDKLDAEIAEKQSMRIRATYYAGWANYYLAIFSTGDDSRSTAMDSSEESFRDFLDLSADDDIAELDKDWIDLTNSLQARAFAGLGMILAARGDQPSCQAVFSRLLDSEVASSVRSQATLWQLQGWLNADNIDQALQLARSVIRNLTGAASQQQVQFSISLIGFAAALPSTDPNRSELTALGLEGLARQRQFKLIAEMVDKHGLEISPESNFYLAWILGNRAFAAAEETQEKDQYAEAARLLQQAMAMPNAQSDLRSSGHCRYQLGWALYLSDQFELSAQEFERAALLLASSDPDEAVNAAWKRYESFRELAKSEERFVVQAIEALRYVKTTFPDSRLAQTADFHLSRLQRGTQSTDDTIASLEAVKPDDPNYGNALYELCVLHHRRWSEALAAGNADDGLAGEVAAAVEKFLAYAAGDADVARKLKCQLLNVDIALRSPDRDIGLAKSFLDQARRYVVELAANQSPVIEYHYQRFQIARLEGRDGEAMREAEWLVENAGSSPYVLSALVLLARSADAAVETASDSNRKEAQSESARIYRRLVGVLGTEPNVLQSNKNARVSLFRLGKLESALGEHRSAAGRFDRLLAAMPDNEVYLRYAGRSHFEAGSYDSALASWRRLSSGLKRGSDEWIEARYYVIACQARLNPDEARQVLNQFRLLYPTLENDEWEQRFKSLERQLAP